MGYPQFVRFRYAPAACPPVGQAATTAGASVSAMIRKTVGDGTRRTAAAATGATFAAGCFALAEALHAAAVLVVAVVFLRGQFSWLGAAREQGVHK